MLATFFRIMIYSHEFLMNYSLYFLNLFFIHWLNAT